MRKTVVYLACPMRIGHWTNNVRTAAQISRDLMRKGYSVINPMGSWLLDVAEPMDIDEWLDNDYGLIAVSDCLLRIPGVSEGSDLEMDYAVRENIPVFTAIRDLYRDIPNEQEGSE